MNKYLSVMFYLKEFHAFPFCEYSFRSKFNQVVIFTKEPLLIPYSLLDAISIIIIMINTSSLARA